MNRFLGIIPARAGSKGIPFKNMRPLCGLPLIAYSVRAALDARRLHRVVVSTDSPDIAEYATGLGLVTNRLRPAELAGDTSASVDVVRHELDVEQSESGETFDHAVLLQPTSPLRTARHVDEAIAAYLESGSSSLISVCDAGPAHPQYMYLQNGRQLHKLLDGQIDAPRQAMERVYLRNGAIYITERAYLRDAGRLVSPDPAFYVMDRQCSINIDEPADLVLAEALLTA